MNANEKEKNVEKFSEKSLLSLGDYYVYGLIDPRNRKIFYIGKGTGNRVLNMNWKVKKILRAKVEIKDDSRD